MGMAEPTRFGCGSSESGVMPLSAGGEEWKLRMGAMDVVGRLEVRRWTAARGLGARRRDAGAEKGWRRRGRLGRRVSARWSIVGVDGGFDEHGREGLVGLGKLGVVIGDVEVCER